MTVRKTSMQSIKLLWIAFYDSRTADAGWGNSSIFFRTFSDFQRVVLLCFGDLCPVSFPPLQSGNGVPCPVR